MTVRTCANPALAGWQPSMRPLVENAIQALIDFLDAVDGDADGECEPDEPSLGWTRPEAAYGRYGDVRDDREHDDGDHDDGDRAESEPSLGAPIGCDYNQIRWAWGSGDDREDDDEHGTGEHGGDEYGPGYRRAA